MEEERVERRRDRRMEDEARELHRVMIVTRTNQALVSVAIAAFCLFTIIGVLAYGIVNTNNRSRETADLTQEGIGCIIEQFAEHRANSIAAHDQIKEGIDGEGVKRPIPNAVIPDDLSANIRQACERFLK